MGMRGYNEKPLEFLETVNSYRVEMLYGLENDSQTLHPAHLIYSSVLKELLVFPTVLHYIPIIGM